MRVEHIYPGRSLGHLRGSDGQPRTTTVTYWTTGEVACPGEYECTLCGLVVWLRESAPLPVCSACDGTEFIATGEGSLQAQAA